MEFKDKLTQLRKERGISQQELGNAIYVSRSAVAKWENGLGIPGKESMDALIDYFGVPLEEIETEHVETVIVEKNYRIRRLSASLISIAFAFSLLICAVIAMLITDENYGFTPEAVAGSYANCPYIENDDYVIYYMLEFEGTQYENIGSFRAIRKTLLGYYYDSFGYDEDVLLRGNQWIGKIYMLQGKDHCYYIVRRNVHLDPPYYFEMDEVVALGFTLPVQNNSYFVSEQTIPGFWIGNESFLVGY